MSTRSLIHAPLILRVCPPSTTPWSHPRAGQRRNPTAPSELRNKEPYNQPVSVAGVVRSVAQVVTQEPAQVLELPTVRPNVPTSPDLRSNVAGKFLTLLS